MPQILLEPPDTRELIAEDGKPVESAFLEKQYHLLTLPLTNSWTPPDGKPFRVHANVGLFFADKKKPMVPDAMLSLNVPGADSPRQHKNKSYFVWIAGKVPDVVIEIVSRTTNDEDGRKLRQYQKRGIPNYAIFDPDHFLSRRELRAFRLVDGRYRANPEAEFPEIGLSLKVWKGEYEGVSTHWLRWFDLYGKPIMAPQEGRADERRQKEDAQRKLRLLMEKFGVSEGEL